MLVSASIALFAVAVAWPMVAGARLLAIGGQIPATFDGTRTLVATLGWSVLAAACATVMGWPVGRAIRSARNFFSNRIRSSPRSFKLELVSRIFPAKNTKKRPSVRFFVDATVWRRGRVRTAVFGGRCRRAAVRRERRADFEVSVDSAF